MVNARRGLRLGLGPVFVYEALVASRRWQGYALRSLFVGALLTALLMIWSQSTVRSGPVTIRGLASLAENFYIGVIGTQLTLVLLAAPAAAAGAICQDRASGTLAHLLVTDLSDTEIVLGKLAARLVPVLGLVVCALPLLCLLTLLGGVDPEVLFGAFLVTIGTAVLGCSLALVFSLWARKTHEALLGTYAVWGIWLIGRPFVGLVNRAFGWSLWVPSKVSDPYYLAFAPHWYPGATGRNDPWAFLAITTAAAIALAVLAVVRLRWVCAREQVARKQSVRGRIEQISRRLDPARFLPGPSLDFNPVLWREWHRARPSRGARITTAVFVIGAAVASVAAMIMPRSSFTAAWVNGFQVSIGMLLLSVTAATSLAEERARRSLDVLMATTLSTRKIVVEKWLSTFRFVPWLAVLPVLVIIANDPFRSNYAGTVVMTLLFVLVCGAAITGMGLAMATWCSRLSRAVGLTVTTYVLVAVG